MSDFDNLALIEYKSLLKNKTPFYVISRIGGKDKKVTEIRVFRKGSGWK